MGCWSQQIVGDIFDEDAATLPGLDFNAAGKQIKVH
jgi:hypothetical protein